MAAEAEAYDAKGAKGDVAKGVTVTRDAGGAGFRVQLWDGTTLRGALDAGDAGHRAFQEIESVVGDFEFLLNSRVYFEMKYDPGCIGPAASKWLQSEFEPALNCCAAAKHGKNGATAEHANQEPLLTFDVDAEDHFSMIVHKPKVRDDSKRADDGGAAEDETDDDPRNEQASDD